jgi:hypothetical protein
MRISHGNGCIKPVNAIAHPKLIGRRSEVDIGHLNHGHGIHLCVGNHPGQDAYKACAIEPVPRQRITHQPRRRLNLCEGDNCSRGGARYADRCGAKLSASASESQSSGISKSHGKCGIGKRMKYLQKVVLRGWNYKVSQLVHQLGSAMELSSPDRRSRTGARMITPPVPTPPYRSWSS